MDNMNATEVTAVKMIENFSTLRELKILRLIQLFIHVV